MKKLLSRILIELDTPLHAGGGEAGVMTDQPVVRDCFDCYMIPGASLAGVLRRHLEAAEGPGTANSLFGWGAEPGSKQDNGEGSRISISDACLVDLDEHVARELELEGKPVNFPIGTAVRDHVRIDTDSGTAMNGGKFDIELVPPCTRFAFEMSLNCEGLSKEKEEKLRLQYFSLLAAMKSKKIQVGGGRTRGLGWFSLLDDKSESETREFNLNDKEGLKAWLNLSRGLMFEDDDKGERIKVPVDPGSTETAEHTGFTGRVEIPLESIGPLLIGGGSLEAEADLTFYSMTVPDYENKNTRQVCMIPAASVKGVIRSRISKILRYLQAEDPAKIIDGMFGTIDEKPATVGKVRIKDIMLDNSAKAVNVQHVAIDRLTGGALDGALYTEAPVWTDKLKIKLEIEFDDLSQKEAELLIHALMDLAEGDLAIGAGGNRGNGRFRLKDDSKVFKKWGEEVSKALNNPEVINNG